MKAKERPKKRTRSKAEKGVAAVAGSDGGRGAFIHIY